MKRWSQSDIDGLKKKGLHVDSFGGKATEEKASGSTPAAFALGRLKSGVMNKTESAYYNFLKVQLQVGEVLWYQFEPMNLKLGDRCFYKVDFLVMVKSGHLEVHEVKGYWTDDALVKIKVAAANFPFRFVALRLIKGEWQRREF